MSIELKERYDAKCPHCKYEFSFAPSIFHQMGDFSLGGGSCPQCETFLRLVILDDDAQGVGLALFYEDQRAYETLMDEFKTEGAGNGTSKA